MAKKMIKAKVVSDKMEKSAVVEVERRFIHPLYKKVVTRTTKYLVHNPGNKAKAGDEVMIKQTRPLSKRKRWVIVEIVKASANV